MAFCTKCGAQVQGPFCGTCGTPAPMGGAPQPGAASQPAAGSQPGSAAPPPGTPPAAPAYIAPVSATAPQKTGAVVGIRGGCGGLVVRAALVGGIAMYSVAQKAKEFGKNPAPPLPRMIATANPDVD